jgi:hypothetical protein
MFFCGCGPDNGLTMGRVSGTVTYNGQPVEFGDILFEPDSEKGNNGVPSMGSIGKDGTFVMSTQESGDGVIAGYHKVGIRALDPTGVGQEGETSQTDSATASGKDMLASRQRQRKAQTAAIKNRAKNDAPSVSFNGKVYRFLTPEKLANPQTSGIRVKISRGSNRVSFAVAQDGSVTVTP